MSAMSTNARADWSDRGHVLLVSFHYLDGTSEGLCAARTARALASSGWTVTVLAGESRQDRDAGDDLGTGTSGPRVERIAAEPRGWRRGWARLNRAAGRGLLQRIASAGLNLAFGGGAEESAWVSAAADRGRALLAQTDPAVDVVFSRLNPMVSHLAAERIVRSGKGLQGQPELPWIAYFSDPWPFFLYPPPYRSRSGRLYRRRALGIARRICERADALLFPSRRLAESLAPVYRIPADRIHVAPHMGPGASESRGQGGAPAEDQDDPRLVLRHAGYLMKERRVDGLFEALLALDETQRNRIRVQFMGRRAPGLEVPAALDGVVTFLAPRPPAEARRWMAEADVALLVEADCDEGVFLPSKFAEYVVDGYPLLCLSPAPGTIDDYLADGGGLRVGPTDVQGIASALQTLLEAKQAGRLEEFAPDAALRRAFRPDVVVGQVEAALRAARERKAR